MTKLYDRTIGDGPEPVVFLHGLFGQGKNFANVARLMTDTITCTMLDLPNHGRSPWTDSLDHDYIASLVAEDLVERGAAERPITLMGHSMGGKVAMRLALRHPELLRRLVVEDIAPAYQPDMSEFDEIVAALQAIDLAELQGREDADAALRDTVRSQRTRSFLLTNLHRDADGGWRWQLNLDLLGSNMAQIGAWDDIEEGVSFDGPTLWLAGERSWFAAPSYAETMAGYFPRLRREVIADAGHWVHWQAPGEVAETLGHFLLVT